MEKGHRDVDNAVLLGIIVLFVILIIYLFPDEISRWTAIVDRFLRDLLAR